MFDNLMTIYVNGRTVNLARPIKIGTEGENCAVVLAFAGLPRVADGQLVTLNWLTDGDEPVGDICALDYSDELQAYGMWVESSLTQFAGRQVTAYLEVQQGALRWRTYPFILDATALPHIEATLEPTDPTIIQQVKDALEQANAAADRAEEAAQRAEEALPNFGPENAGKLLYIGPDGKAIPLELGAEHLNHMAEGISSLKDTIDDLDNVVYGSTNKQINPEWLQGIPAADSGIPINNSTRIRTEYIQIPSRAESIVMSAESGYKMAYYCYAKDKTLLAKRFWIGALPFELKILPEWESVIVGLSYTDDSAITPDAASAATIEINFSDPFESIKEKMDEMEDSQNVTFGVNSSLSSSLFEPDGMNGMYIKIPGMILLRGAYAASYTFSDVFADMLTTSPQGVSGCIYIPHNSSLIFNVNTRKLEIVNSLDTENHIAIFKVGQDKASGDGVVGGIGQCYYEEWLADKKLESINVIFTIEKAVKNAYFEPQGASGLYISIPGGWYIRGAYSENYSFPTVFADILTTSPNGVSDCIFIPHSSSLIFNVDTRKLEIVNSLVTENHIAIFKVGMGNAQSDSTDAVIGGIGHWIYMQWQAAQYVSGTKLPKYWTTEIGASVEVAQEKMMAVGIDGETFLFITDLHWHNNVRYSPYITADLVKRLGIKNIVLGGDYIGGGEKTVNALLMSDCLAGYRDIDANLFPIFGNHDRNTIGAPSYDDCFTDAGVFALINNHLKNVDYGGYCYYAYDNELTKTRYIFLDTGLEGSSLSATQQTWFEAMLNATPAEYKVLVFGHIIYQPTSWTVPFIDTLKRTPLMNTICTLCDAFNDAQDGREVVGIIGGHVHLDLSYTTDGGIPIILLDSDSKQTFSNSGSASGTINEQCISVVTVDCNNRKIYVTRAGRGDDLEFDY